MSKHGHEQENQDDGAEAEAVPQAAKRRHIRVREYDIEGKAENRNGTKVKFKAKVAERDEFEGLDVESIDPKRNEGIKILAPFRLALSWLTGIDID